MDLPLATLLAAPSGPLGVAAAAIALLAGGTSHSLTELTVAGPS